MRFGVAQFERINDHSDVGGIFSGLAHVRDFDQFKIGFMHRRLEAFVAVPVAIRLFDNDASLDQQALENRLDIEFFILRIGHAERDVFEIAEQRHADVVVGRCHE